VDRLHGPRGEVVPGVSVHAPMNWMRMESARLLQSLQRIVLSPDVMRVVSFIQVWNVRRGEVQETDLEDGLYALVIALTDGSTIDPFMFMIWGKAGLTRNAMSRKAISERITEWNAGALPDIASNGGPLAWRQIRLNLILLLGLSAVVAVGAIALTAANIW
jgi:hypothetical protein